MRNIYHYALIIFLCNYNEWQFSFENHAPITP